MSTISPTGSASVWSYYDPFRAERAAHRQVAAPVQLDKGLNAAEVRSRLVSSATALRNAFSFLSQNLRRITMPRLEGVAGTKALARATIVPASTYTVLQTTQEINASSSAARASAAALELDVTSPEAQSVLESIGAIGLDVTSPEQSTVLQSSSSLGLDTTTPQSASVIQSTAEANTMTTSYGVVQATFNNGQTSLGNLSGTYRGTGAAANATSLTLTVTSLSGTMGSLLPTAVSVKATDQNGTDLGTYSGLLRTGDQLSLGNDIGLNIAFTAGSIRTNAATTFSVSRTTPTTVDANALFNASNVNNRPRFDNGAQVTAGSFSVNGTSVQVLANDSINSVLQRINSTVSGVVASYQNDRVVIQSSGPSEDNIALAGDTSGFLTALKLTGATTARGNVRDDLQVFSKTTQFAAVTAGSFRVNGQTISINPTADSLNTVLVRINNSSAGVVASYDATSGNVVLTTSDPTEDPIVVDNDTTGFLAAAKLSTNNSVLGNIRDDRQVLGKVSAFSSVTNGSFLVNGVAISVDRSIDTMETIVAWINSAGAGVSALYDSASDKLVLTTTSNSEDEIVLSGDTSGFLSAVKIAGASTVRGNIRDDEQTLNKVAQFSSVQSGSFQLNGATITVDTATDSLNSILARINASAAGVTATYDPTENRVILDPGNGNPLDLSDDTSGFLEAIQVEAGTFATLVNENGAFNASGLSGPRFETGVSVTAGSFKVNGVEITVDAGDTIQTVLDKISASSAGVTATFNAATESVTLRAKQAGQQQILLDDDTSGFLAAVKLDGTADLTYGSAGNEMLLRDAVPGILAGTIQVNNQTISVDPDTDSIVTLVQELDALNGVEASLDSSTGALAIRSEAEGGSVTIADSSGALSALGIFDGTYVGEAATFRTVHAKNGKFQVLNREKVVDRVVEAFAKVNQTLESLQKATGLTLAFRDDIHDAVRDGVGTIRDAQSKGFTILNEAGKPLSVKIERSLLSNALRQNGRVLEELYKGEKSLADALEHLAESAQANFVSSPAAAKTAQPTPAAAVAGDVADDFYKVASASQLYLIDAITNAGLTTMEPSPVLESHERDSSGDMEGS
jgi:hypothetical protein